MNLKGRAALGAFLLGMACTAGAQAATNDNDTDIPKDLGAVTGQGEPGTSPAAEAAGSSGAANLAMGLWAQAYADVKSLTRDIATGEKEGYELDTVALYSKANWWFWGNLTERTRLDAEIGVWNAKHTLYQANSYADNVPTVTWADGLQTLAGIPFSPIDALNGGLAAGVNKLGFEADGDYLRARVGYGKLGKAGMSEFIGIFNVLDRWDDVGAGYLEILNGSEASALGDELNLQALLGLSRARSKYGFYALTKADWKGLVQGALTAASLTGSDELFRYNETWENAYSAWLSVRPSEGLSLAVHGIAAQGSAYATKTDTMAAGASLQVTAGTYGLSLAQTAAGGEAATVWGDDSTLYAGKWHTLLDQSIGLGPVRAGLRNEFTLYGLEQPFDSPFLVSNEPFLDLDLLEMTGLDVLIGAYGVINAEKIDEAVDVDSPLSWTLAESGIELGARNLAGMRSLTLDWAVSLSYGEWNADKGSSGLDRVYHSVMAAAQVDDVLSASLAALVRANEGAADDTFVPYGCGAGVELQTDWAFLHSPSLWINAAWGMDPFKSESGKLYRRDDPDNGLGRRSYLLNDLYAAASESRVRFGMIWNY